MLQPAGTPLVWRPALLAWFRYACSLRSSFLRRAQLRSSCLGRPKPPTGGDFARGTSYHIRSILRGRPDQPWPIAKSV